MFKEFKTYFMKTTVELVNTLTIVISNSNNKDILTQVCNQSINNAAP